mgnify:CR=1 FL=1
MEEDLKPQILSEKSKHSSPKESFSQTQVRTFPLQKESLEDQISQEFLPSIQSPDFGMNSNPHVSESQTPNMIPINQDILEDKQIKF